MKSFYIKLAAVLLVTLSILGVANSAYASTGCIGDLAATCINFQSDKSITSSGSGQVNQTLGNGMTGVLYNMDVWVAFGSATAGANYSVNLNSCPDSTYTGCVTVFGQENNGNIINVPSSSAVTATNYVFSTTTGITIDPARYYLINISYISALGGDPGTNRVKVLGCSSSCYSGGSLTIGGLADMYFFLGGVQTTFSTPYVTLISPSNASTTQGTNAHFSFSYNAPTTYGIDKYVLNLIDDTYKAAIFTADSTSTAYILNLGGSTPNGTSGTVSFDVSLTAGHIYEWNACIYNSHDIGGTCWGAPGRWGFVVVTDNGTLQWTFDSSGAGTSTFSTSSIPTGSSFTPFGTLINSITDKIPFSYMKEIYLMWKSKDLTGSNENIGGDGTLIDVNLHSLGIGSTSPTGNFLPDLKITTSTIGSMFPPGGIALMLTIQDAAYFLTFVIYLWKRVPRALSSL